MTPGSYGQGTVAYTDAAGIPWGAPGDPFDVELTTLGAVGQSIDGQFKANVTHGGNAAHAVDGTFHVCRVPDELAP